jgi:hypothetical protein
LPTQIVDFMHSWKSTSYLRAFSIAVTVSNAVFLD